MDFTVDDVRAVARLLKEHNLAEIAIESTVAAQPSRLLVRRAPGLPPASPQPGPAGGLGTATSVSTATPGLSAGNGGATAVADAANEPELITIKSTAVGLFRNAEPAVQSGDRVRVGQVVGVVESLKVPNEIGALVHGEVMDVLVEEGQGVEYGQPLLVLRPQHDQAAQAGL